MLIRLNQKTCVLILVVCVIPCWSCSRPVDSSSDSSQQGPAQTLKIVNWNVLYGFNHGQSVDAGALWVAEQQPDVVALQELNGFTGQRLEQLAGGSSGAGWGHAYTAILKEDGFPVGLTSTAPIQVIKRQVDQFHHGYLHCRTHGIHFFVVHFWPGKDHEGEQVAGEIQQLLAEDSSVILLGDFNTHSPRDAGFLEQQTGVTPQFNVVAHFEEIGLIDLVAKHQPDARFTCPSPITIPRWSADEAERLSRRQRIDFIFASADLATQSTEGYVVTTNEVETISDHYPVIATMVIDP